MSPAAFVFTPGVILGMALLAIACAVGCVLLIAWTMTQGECDCPPRVLRTDAGGYVSKVFHSEICKFRSSN